MRLSIRSILCILLAALGGNFSGWAEPAKPLVRVACVGDSITAGAKIPAPSVNAYPAQLGRMLDKGWEVQNFGASGSTLMNLDQQAYQKTGAFNGISRYKPDIIVIMLGTNDTKPENWKFKEQFAADYKDLIGKLKTANPASRLYLCHPPTVFGADPGGINDAALSDEISMIDKIAAEEGARIIDVHKATEANAGLFVDGVHPNEEGANVIARTVFEGVTGQKFTGVMAQELHSTWSGYARLDFIVDSRACILVSPPNPAAGKPWIWRTEFFGAWPQADIALLAKGYHVAYMDVQNMYGAPVGLDHMDQFYRFILEKYQLSSKVVLEGFSRGGLFAFNWAARHPDRVACLYVDAPVCDFKSWPAGKGHGTGSPGDWAACMRVYGLTEEQAMSYPLNPIDHLKPLAEAKISIFGVCGDADPVVPMDENLAIVEKRYRDLGGDIQVIVKPGVGHHPHSLSDPRPIVDFVVSHCGTH